MLGLSFLFSGCDGLFPPVNEPPTESGVAELLRFQSEQEFRDYLKKQIEANQSVNDGFGFRDFLGGFLPLPAAAPELGENVAVDGDSAGGGGDFSETNVQEAGVDESDFVKTDGQHLYILSEDKIRIVTADPAQPQQVGTIPVNGFGDALYLHGDLLIALTNRNNFIFFDDLPGPLPPELIRNAQGADAIIEDFAPQTQITLVDVSDPANASVIKTIDMEGSLNTSRLIDGHLHVILNLYPNLPSPLTASEIDDVDLATILPEYAEKSGDGTVIRDNMVQVTDTFHPIDFDGLGMTVISTIDLGALDEAPKTTAVMADVATVYASTQSLFLTDANYNFFGNMRETTDLYKFSLTGEEPALVAAGTVKGRLLSQYSLSEYQDHLRVATTSRDNGSGGPAVDFAPPTPQNNVYVLDTVGDELTVVGSIENIAPGEQIFAARFVGPRGFLVTFVQVDPLFTLDLAEPTNPQIVGELKVDGVSDYIHLLDEDHLVTVGRAATPQGDFALFRGVQLSVFDVTDFANPAQQHSVEIGNRGTSTEVQYNPKAFTLFGDPSLLALPIDLYENTGPDPTDPGVEIFGFGQFNFAGIYVYRVTVEDGFDFLGRVSTTSDAIGFYGTGKRGVFIGDHLYAVTGQLVRVVPINDINAEAATLVLD
jgi:uncharacterized secreted protein with C-terminal beta-propeller domain